MKKKLSSVVFLLLSAVLILAACSKSGQTKESAPAASESAKSAGPVELHVMFASFGGDKSFIDDFNAQNPDIKVKAEFIPTENYIPLIQTKSASGDMPDIFYLFPIYDQLKNYVKQNALLPLNDMPEAGTFVPNSLDLYTADGKTYGFPTASEIVYVMYNKKLFQKLNISVPKNWDEFLQVCETLKKNNVTPIALGAKTNWLPMQYTFVTSPTKLYNKNPDWDTKHDKGEVSFDSEPAWKETLNVFKQLQDNKYFNDNPLSTTNEQALDMFAKEQAGMVVNGTWVLSSLKELNPNLEVGGFPFPANKPGEELVVMLNNSSALGISSKTKHPEAAKKFMAYYVNTETVAKIWKGSNSSPIQGQHNEVDPSINEFLGYAKGMKSRTMSINYWPNAFLDPFQKELELLLAGKPIDDVLKSMEASYRKNFK